LYILYFVYLIFIYLIYMFQPKMEDIPDGDWYCYECISRATGEACCVVCGKAGVKLVECEYCPRSMHIDCMDPPMARCPKKWACAACSIEQVRVCIQPLCVFIYYFVQFVNMFSCLYSSVCRCEHFACNFFPSDHTKFARHLT